MTDKEQIEEMVRIIDKDTRLMYHCDNCNDKGYIEYEKDGYQFVKECECVKVRKSLINAESSGLGELLNIYTFEHFKTDLAFQKDLYNKAQEYINDESNKWFAVLGKSGAGKSHICTAICGELLKKGYEVRFMAWIEESRKLKSRITEKEYDSIIEPLKDAEVLYIDDFFKSENTTPPSNADIKLANEILNYRYNKSRIENKKLKTIISSERTLSQLIGYDEAIAGRIVEMSDKYIKVLKDNAVNYRLRKFI